MSLSPENRMKSQYKMANKSFVLTNLNYLEMTNDKQNFIHDRFKKRLK